MGCRVVNFYCATLQHFGGCRQIEGGTITNAPSEGVSVSRRQFLPRAGRYYTGERLSRLYEAKKFLTSAPASLRSLKPRRRLFDRGQASIE